ncbi:MAG: AAA family ATPase [Geothermobacteraceae bacterium]
MYLKHFGFDRKPFNITPNPDFIFLSETHREAFAHLLYGIRNRAGFIVLTGEVGTGKTTVLRTLLNQLDEQIHKVALIFNPALSSVELLRNILREFGLQPVSESLDDLHHALNHYLLEQNRVGHTVVLIIDEAQNLAPEVLEQVRLLSNLETETDKLIQIVLVGQPELDRMLERDDLRQLRQRVTVRYCLASMSDEDTVRYIRHRLAKAGGREDLFDAGCFRLILKECGGNPRLVNILCDRSLLAAYGDEAGRVNPAHVRQALDELWRHHGVERFPARRRLVTGLLLFLLLLSFGLLLAERGLVIIPGLFDEPGGSMITATTSSQPLSEQVSPAGSDRPAETTANGGNMPLNSPAHASFMQLEELRRALSEDQAARSLMSAAKPLLELLNVPAGGLAPDISPAELARHCRQAGVDLSQVDGGLEQLLAFNRPALLELLLPGTVRPRYLALTGREGNRIEVQPGIGDVTSLSIAELRGLWSGRAYIPWRNFDRIVPVGRAGQVADEVRDLQLLLHKAGFSEVEPTGVYDRQTIEAVTLFQARAGLIQDGRVGPQTLMLLYQHAGYPVVSLEGKGQAS